MKRLTLFITSLAFNVATILSLQAQSDFITIWNTNLPGGSGSGQITIATYNGFFYDIYWEEVSDPMNTGYQLGGFGSTTVTFPHDGIYRVKITPGIGAFNEIKTDNSGDHLRLIDIEQWGTIQWTSMFSAFESCKNLTVISATDVPDLSNATSLGYMFNNCSRLVHVPGLENWDLSHITSLPGMFQQDTLFNQNIGGWDVSNVYDISGLFSECYSFNQDISNWDVSNVTIMFGTFSGARSFNQDIGGWDVGNVTYMYDLFFGAWSFNQDISGWNVSNVISMGDMFWDASAFNQDISSWDVSSATIMANMFAGTTVFNQDIGGWDVSQVTDMSHMFLGATAFSHDIGAWDVGNVSNMEGMFVGAENFNSDIGSWDVSKVVNMSNMFVGNPIFNQDLSGWNISNVSDMSGMFHEAFAFNHPLGAWQLREGVNMTNMLDQSGMDCINYSKTLLGWAGNPGTPDGLTLGAQDVAYGSDALESRNTLLSKGWTITDDEEDTACPYVRDPCITIWQTDLPGSSNNNQITIPSIGVAFAITWEEVNNTINHGSLIGNGVTTITFPSSGVYQIKIIPGTGTFEGLVFNNTGDKLKLLTLDQWGTSPWTVAANAFYGCENMKVSAVDIPVYDSVTSMHNMFHTCTSLSTIPNANAWDTDPIVDMGGMFAMTDLFQQDLYGWNVSNVIVMDSMFYNAVAFNGNISDWDVGAVTDMSYMFYAAHLFSQDIGLWNTAAVTDMKYMLYNAFAFNRNIGDWDLSSLNAANNAMEGMISFSGMDCKAYGFTLVGWSANPQTPDDLALGADDLMYAPGASAAKNNLLILRNWTITDGGTDANCELYSDKFITVWRTNNTGQSNNNQILIPATGTNFSIYWELVSNTAVNGTAVGSGATTLTFPASGVYRVKIFPGSGTFNRMQFAATGDGLKLLRIENWGSIVWSNFLNAYNGCTNLTVIATDTIVLSGATSMSAMFQNCSSLTTVPSMNTWTMNTITNTSLMFYGATNFDQPISNWNTGNVVNMSSMFYGAVAFNQPIASWNVAKVNNMSEMFNGASAFNQPIGGWNTGLVTNMTMLFKNAFSFNQSLNGWNVSKVTNMNELFHDAISFNGNISSWNTILVTNMSHMFSGAIAFNQNIGSWNTGNVTSMFSTFNGASAFNQNIGSWNTAKVTTMFWMFRDATSFNQPLGAWNVGNVTNMSSMFNNASSFNQNIANWNMVKVTDMGSMFNGAAAFNQNIGMWNVAKVTSMVGTFKNAISFDQNIGMWNTGKVTNFAAMFDGASVFNQNISNWNTAKATGMSFMFSGASSFNQNIGAWSTGSVTNMNGMFQGAVAFDQDIGAWAVDSVTLFSDFLNNAGLSVSNYDSLLIGWSTQNLKPNVIFDAGTSQYCAGEAARDQIISTDGWIIDDNGKNCCAFSTTWNGTSWSNGSPTAMHQAIFTADYDTALEGNIQACNMVILPGVTVTVEANDMIEVGSVLDLGGILNVMALGSLMLGE